MEEIIALEERHTSGLNVKRPIALVRGQGAMVWDADGRAYLDCMTGHGVATLGHCHPEVTAAIQTQAATLVACSEAVYNDQRAALMEELTHHTPGDLKRVFLCNSGAESIEAAIKFARFFTGRTEVVAAMRGFHGRTLGALSATWNAKYRDPFLPLVPGFRHVPFNNLAAMEDALTDQTAAVIIEVIQGEGGVHPADPAYLEGLRALCTERGVLLIVDEVQTGMGRTGRWFACEHFGVLPDMLCLGKALGGGVPMGAVIWREALGKLPAGIHGSTFGGNPLACAASRAVVHVMERDDLPGRAARLGAKLLADLRAIRSPLIREVRGRGLMVGVELRRRATQVLRALMERGVLAMPAGSTVVRLLPPLVIAEEQLDQVVQAMAQALADVMDTRGEAAREEEE
ncbi:MAG: aspartate aminotransferase family protein [Ardenticatenia bacterium]|nr:MAG: aspartate aminotransferase family protein [Ardenticatenia bacterium]